MTTPVVISQTCLPRAVEHAASDVDAVLSGVRASGVSDREVLEVLGSMLSLQRQVNGTVSVLMAVAEQRNVAWRTANTPLESVLAVSRKGVCTTGAQPGLPGHDARVSTEGPCGGRIGADHLGAGAGNPRCCGGAARVIVGR